jgi:hypothetical protein
MNEFLLNKIIEKIDIEKEKGKEFKIINDKYIPQLNIVVEEINTLKNEYEGEF